MNKTDCTMSLITLVMTRLSLSMQLLLELSSDEEDDDFFLAVTYLEVSTCDHLI